MSQATLVHDGVTYTLEVNTEESRTHIALTTSRPPLGLSPCLYEFLGRLGTREQERNAAELQAKAAAAPLSAHDGRNKR